MFFDREVWKVLIDFFLNCEFLLVFVFCSDIWFIIENWIINIDIYMNSIYRRREYFFV